MELSDGSFYKDFSAIVDSNGRFIVDFNNNFFLFYGTSTGTVQLDMVFYTGYDTSTPTFVKHLYLNISETNAP